jgi:hypothetical protein
MAIAAVVVILMVAVSVVVLSWPASEVFVTTVVATVMRWQWREVK